MWEKSKYQTVAQVRNKQKQKVTITLGLEGSLEEIESLEPRDWLPSRGRSGGRRGQQQTIVPTRNSAKSESQTYLRLSFSQVQALVSVCCWLKLAGGQVEEK